MFDSPGILPPDLERQIEEDYRTNTLSPWRCRDEDALRRVDAPRDRPTVLRPAFVRDVEKVINVPAYNRYAGKTQVFSFLSNDDISRRGLHVQLVSRIARDIARPLGLNLDLVEAIALCHDIGHTPFGHAGERCLDQVYMHHTGMHFAHNVHSVQVMDRMYGRNLSLQTLDGALCHNGEYERPSFSPERRGDFASFDAVVAECIAQGAPRIDDLVPCTLEGCVVRLADIISYVGKDRQDAELAGIIDENTPFETGVVGAYNSWVIGAMVTDIVTHSYGKNRIEMSGEAFEELSRAKAENYRLIYHSPVVGGECAAVIEPRFEALYDRLKSDLLRGDETAEVFRHHVHPVCRHAGYYRHEYDWESDPDRTVMDFIASMTDDYFTALYERYFPAERGSTPWRGYF